VSTATARVLGRTPDAATLRSDLEAYRLLALERGASAAAVATGSDVIVGGRVRLKCVVPRCVRAGETPHCTPFGLDLELVRRAFGRFSWAILFKCDVTPMADYLPGRGQAKEEQRRVLAFHKQSGEVVDAIERRAYKHLAMGFGGDRVRTICVMGSTARRWIAAAAGFRIAPGRRWRPLGSM
jgi:hypothetical protein